jgi:uncharacterized membrane protein YebE (DUF533 family)
VCGSLAAAGATAVAGLAAALVRAAAATGALGGEERGDVGEELHEISFEREVWEWNN